MAEVFSWLVRNISVAVLLTRRTKGPQNLICFSFCSTWSLSGTQNILEQSGRLLKERLKISNQVNTILIDEVLNKPLIQAVEYLMKKYDTSGGDGRLDREEFKKVLEEVEHSYSKASKQGLELDDDEIK